MVCPHVPPPACAPVLVKISAAVAKAIDAVLETAAWQRVERRVVSFILFAGSAPN